jgi:hypothetical protein
MHHVSLVALSAAIFTASLDAGTVNEDAARLCHLLEQGKPWEEPGVPGLTLRKQAIASLKDASADVVAAAFPQWMAAHGQFGAVLLAERWLELDEAAALKFVTGHPGEAAIIEAFETAWARRHPDLVEAWIRDAGEVPADDPGRALPRREFARGPVGWRVALATGEAWMRRDRVAAVKRLDMFKDRPKFQGVAFQGMARAAATVDESKALLDWLASPAAIEMEIGRGKVWEFSEENFFEDCAWQDLAMAKDWLAAHAKGFGNHGLDSEREAMTEVLAKLETLDQRLRAAGSGIGEARTLRDRVCRPFGWWALESIARAEAACSDSGWIAALGPDQAKRLLPLCWDIGYGAASGFREHCLAIILQADPDGTLQWVRRLRTTGMRGAGMERLWDKNRVRDIGIMVLEDLASRDPDRAIREAKREIASGGFVGSALRDDLPSQGSVGESISEVMKTAGLVWCRELGIRKSWERIAALKPRWWREVAASGWIKEMPSCKFDLKDLLWCADSAESWMEQSKAAPDAQDCWNRCLVTMLDAAASIDLPAAVRWLEAKPGRLAEDIEAEGLSPRVGPVLAQWMLTDVEAAMTWYLGAVPKQLRNKNLGYALQCAMDADCLATLLWLPTLRDDSAWPVVCEIMGWRTRIDAPAGAAEWIKGADRQTRTDIVAEIVWYWRQGDAAAANRFLDELEPAGPFRKKIDREIKRLTERRKNS